jgi:hypothetical protein
MYTGIGASFAHLTNCKREREGASEEGRDGWGGGERDGCGGSGREGGMDGMVWKQRGR